jgi:hypothetical protein
MREKEVGEQWQDNIPLLHSMRFHRLGSKEAIAIECLRERFLGSQKKGEVNETPRPMRRGRSTKLTALSRSKGFSVR